MKRSVAVIGGGPAGLMAADAASEAGASVVVFEQMPSVGRKFLMAGKSGLNLTHAEELETFLGRYHDPRIMEVVKMFPPDLVRRFMTDLGIEEHVGSTGRVFPQMMKASPLLRSWLARLTERGVRIETRTRLAGWSDGRHLEVETDGSKVMRSFDSLVFACGGGSWRRLGSDGAWVETFKRHDIDLVAFGPSNVGLRVNWSEHILRRFEGAPVKNIRLTAPDGQRSPGEFVVTAMGIESGAVYPLSHQFARSSEKQAQLLVDLLPDLSEEQVAERLSRQKTTQSLSNRLRKAVRITGIKAALLREGSSPADLQSPSDIAQRLKHLPLPIAGTAPLDEAISTSGGISWSELDERLMLRKIPGVFCAGEMIAWDAPTGGYLLTACLASGALAGKSAAS